MRRSPLLVVASLALVAGLAACGDDDGAGPTPSSRLSTEGVCAVVDAARASEVLGVDFDRTVPSEGSCTYTSSTSRTALTVQVTEQGTTEPQLVLETLGRTCDEGTRRERTVPDADGAFSCLAGGVPNAVATSRGLLVVLTGNSQDDGVTPAMVSADLVALLADAVAGSAES